MSNPSSHPIDAAEQILTLAKRIRHLPGETEERRTAEQSFIDAAYSTDARIRRYAVQALAYAKHPQADLVLIDLWMRESGVAELKALAKAMAQRNNPDILAALERRRIPEDPLLIDLVGKARLMLARDLSRPPAQISKSAETQATNREDAESYQANIHPDRNPAGSVIVELRCRAGLEGALHSEGVARLGAAFKARSGGTGRLRLNWEKPLSHLLQLRLFEDLLILVPAGHMETGIMNSQSLMASLNSSAAQLAFRTWGKKPYRFRLDWQGPGRQKADMWQAVSELHLRYPDLLNDPRTSDWELEVDPQARFWGLRPKGLAKSRFRYRNECVDASSHAPFAAALARIAGCYADDIVWDPFCGAGTELIERAYLGPYKEMHGSDLSPEAIESARANCITANVENYALHCEDALARFQHASKKDDAPTAWTPNLIISNPPLGRRVTGFDVESLLQDFLRVAANILPSKGRLVWISPQPERTREWAEELGLELRYEQKIDMGGFHAAIQRFDQI